MSKSFKLKQDDRIIMQSIYEKISSNPTDHITLSNLAFDAGINTTKLTYGFKQVFGMTVHEYLVHLRMKRAETLLLLTDKDVKTIALMTGYKTKSSFTVAFKKQHGIAPHQWREKNSMITL
jgi:AraC-like DNA-binding protein